MLYKLYWGKILLLGGLLSIVGPGPAAFAQQWAYPVPVNEGWVLVSGEGQRLSAEVYDSVALRPGGWYQTYRSGRTGLRDSTGELVLRAVYHRLHPPGRHNRIAAEKPPGQWYLFDLSGRVASPQPYDELGPFRNGSAPLRMGRRWGYCDAKGAFLLPPQFDAALPMSEGYGAVQAAGKWTLVSPEGDFVTEPQYDSLGRLQNGRAPVWQHGHAGFLSPKGQVAIEFMFEDVRGFRRGKAPVKLLGKWGLVDRKGSYLATAAYQNVGSCSSFGCSVQQNGRWGLLDNSGLPVRGGFRYRNAPQFREGRAAVATDDGWGYISPRGEVLLPFEYNAATPFRQGRAVVQTAQGAWVLINTAGEVVTRPKLD